MRRDDAWVSIEAESRGSIALNRLCCSFGSAKEILVDDETKHGVTQCFW